MIRKLVMLALSVPVAFTVFAADVPLGEGVRLQEKGIIKSFEQVQAQVLELHPDAIIDETELHNVMGRFVYSVEIINKQNVEWEVDIDAVSGEIIKNQIDD